jgi:hypothetical protein
MFFAIYGFVSYSCTFQKRVNVDPATRHLIPVVIPSSTTRVWNGLKLERKQNVLSLIFVIYLVACPAADQGFNIGGYFIPKFITSTQADPGLA